MKLAIVGSRTFNDIELLSKTLDSYKSKISFVVSGGAKGADYLAEVWAKNNNVPTIVHKPDWKKYGKSAGIARNEHIVKDCDECVAFWDGKSKGTQNTIDKCRKLNKKVTVIKITDVSR